MCVVQIEKDVEVMDEKQGTQILKEVIDEAQKVRMLKYWLECYVCMSVGCSNVYIHAN